MEKKLKGNPSTPKVVDVEPKEDHTLLLTFTNGETKLFDAKGLLQYEVYKPLENIAFFNLAKVDHGGVVWPGDLDLCYHTLYPDSEPL
ncbi:MAG: DUF2442 domain-containing protein [Eggerthellaceae bacterium]|nr:DUF2442 domain-containing protein [Eggerthellaceae bacterium]